MVNTSRWSEWARLAAFVALTALIVVMASERAYWTIGGLSVETLVGVPAFYLLPTGAALWALAAAGAQRTAQVVAGGAIFAFVVEGVLTAVVYEDGPLPVLALMFVGWHGLIAFVGFWYLIRRWLVERRRLALSMSAVAFGVYWGTWSLTWTLPDPFGTDPVELAELGAGATALTPIEFLWYSLTVGAILAAAHWLLGFVWPRALRAGRRTGVTIAVLAGVYHGVAVLPAVMWAPLKLGALIGGAWWLLRRVPKCQESDIFSALHGRVLIRDAALVMAMPIASAVTYWVLWAASLSDASVQGLLETMVFSQVIAGAAGLIWAARRTRAPAAPRPAATIAPDGVAKGLG